MPIAPVGALVADLVRNGVITDQAGRTAGEYARDVARRHPEYFEWVASIHPYRKDALEALEQAKRDGARAVKWLPSAMGIDPASPQCDRFYESLSKNNIPLIAHGGLERAVLGREAHDIGNPLRLRRALEAGVRVVVAHCASLGEDRDLDRGENGPYVESFSIFSRIFEKFDNCHGDISAMTQVNRAGPALARVIENDAWHARLLNGSDYPLPGVMPIFSVDYLVSLKMVEASAADVLREIRLHNPLLFDFVDQAGTSLPGAQRGEGVTLDISRHGLSFIAEQIDEAMLPELVDGIVLLSLTVMLSDDKRIVVRGRVSPDVAVVQVGEVKVEPRDGRLARAAAGSEGVRLHGGHHVNPRHRHAGALRDLFDHGEELRVLGALDLPRAGGAQHDVRGEPVRPHVHRGGDDGEDDDAVDPADGPANGDQQTTERGEQDDRLEVVHGSSGWRVRTNIVSKAGGGSVSKVLSRTCS